MTGALLNDFLVGADPEMVLLNPPELINGQSERKRMAGFYGWDHAGYVLEPHPTPAKSVREVVKNIRRSLHVIGHQFGGYKFRAGAYLTTPQRAVTLGGHVHLDLPSLSREQIQAMDTFTASLVELDILPQDECDKRHRAGLYGRPGDIRSEHGHVEYRSMCSWLFSQKTSMLSMTGIKLCALAPRTLTRMDSYTKLETWLTGFKGKDDDVDWILDRGYLTTSGSMTAKPDNSIKAVWRIDPEQGERLLEATPIQAAPDAPVNTNTFNSDGFITAYRRAYGFTPSLPTIRDQRRRFDNAVRHRIYGERGRFEPERWATSFQERQGRPATELEKRRAYERHVLAYPIPENAPQVQAQPLQRDALANYAAVDVELTRALMPEAAEEL